MNDTKNSLANGAKADVDISGSPLELRANNIAMKRELDLLAPGGTGQAKADQPEMLDSLGEYDIEKIAQENFQLRQRIQQYRRALPVNNLGPISGRCFNIHQAADILGVDSASAGEMLSGLPRSLGDDGQILFKSGDIETFIAEKASGRSGRRFL